MKRASKSLFPVTLLLLTTFVALWIGGCGQKSESPVQPQTFTQQSSLDKQGDKIVAAIAVQNRHTAELLRNHDIVGTAVSKDDDGSIVITVYTARQLGPESIPARIEGIRTKQFVSGRVVAFQATPFKGKPGTSVNPKAHFAWPIPIGVSTGNENECSSGTIGCRVYKNGTAYALSNNHVFALENTAHAGDNIIQPGLYDLQCMTNPAYYYATLSDYVPIVFSLTAQNEVDAAIAQVYMNGSQPALSNSTPSNGYGTPSSTTVSPDLDMSVQKYGRTTGLTSGTITGINATFNISYSSGVARFVNQFVISGKKPFSKAGDSGSLIVTKDANKNPVGLLFAGSTTITIANNINKVLLAFSTPTIQ